MSVQRPAVNPCGSCPYRRDVPSGVWAADEYAKLTEFDGEMHQQAPVTFQCHQHDRGSEHSRLCAGWVGCHGGDNLLGLRIASAFGHMTAEEIEATIDYTTTVPLFGSGAEAAEHGMRDIEGPSESAERAIQKISKRRNDIRMG